MKAAMQCSKCGKTDIDSGTLHKRDLWLLIIAVPLFFVSGWFGWGYIVYPLVRKTASLFVVFVPAIIGFSVLAYAVKQKPVFTYECKDCGHSWRRSAKSGPMEEDPRYTNWQIQRLIHDSVKERKKAAQWLGERRIESAVEPLITCLEDRKIKYEDARKSAAIALAQIGDARAVESLAKTAMDDSWKFMDVRLSAINALGEFNDPQARKTFETLLGEKDVRVRQAAEAALAKLQSS
ncbi:MAG: HEAT repeat domain-containing protein [Desulfobacteraceae bacterium]|jgi:hypothetical protein